MHDLYESDDLSWAVSLLNSSLSEFQNNEMRFHKLHDYYESFPTWRGPHLRVNWENSLHFATPPLVSPRNDVWATTAEIPYWWRVTTQMWVVLFISLSKFSTNQTHYPDLGSVASSVRNFCVCFPDAVLRRKQLWRREMSAGFCGCPLCNSQCHYWIIYAISLKFIPFTSFKNRSNAT